MEETHLRGLLQPGERLLWEGAPERGIRLHRSDAFAIPFSLVWCGFLAIILRGPFQMMVTWNSFYVLIYLPFILAGLYMLIGRFFLRARKLAGLQYAVTDKRVIIASRRETVFFPYDQIPMLQKEIRRDGIGTIWFRQPVYYGSGKHRRQIPGAGFEEIAGAEQVYRLIEGQMLNRDRSYT